jgi:putative hydrolase of the HAD superfamily
MTQLVSYDVWRTLLRANPEYVEQRGKLIATALEWTGDPVNLVRAVNMASKELDRQADAANGIVQYGFTNRVAYAAKHVGLKLPSSTRLIELQKNVIETHLAHLPSLEPDLPDTLRRHHDEGRLVAVISNTGMTEGATLRLILEKLGLLEHIDHEIYSDVLNLAKPDIRIFKELTSQSSTSADKILHVGDNQIADYEGARNAGLQALLYAPRTTVTTPSITRHADIFGHPILAND